MKLSIYFMITLTLVVSVSSITISFGETGRETFLVRQDTFENCWDECTGDDYNSNGILQYLEASFLDGNLISLTLPPPNDLTGMRVSISKPKSWAQGALYFQIPINGIPTSDLFNDVKITKAEFQILALPLEESDDQKSIYSGKLVSSLFLCDTIYDHEYSFHCDYSIRPIDTITVNTQDLPKFLVFDITPVIERAKNKELFFALENKPIEDLNDLDETDFINFVVKHHKEIFYHDYGVDENTNGPEQVSTANIPEILPEVLNQPIRKLSIQKFNPSVEGIVSNNPVSVNSNPILFNIEPDYATFFIIPSSNNRELSTSSVIVDFEILESDLSNAFTYFLGLVLPSIAIIVPAIIWMVKKKS